MGSGVSAIPEDEIEDLIESTSFNRQELKRWYSKFMKEYPEGQLTMDQFNDIYGRIYTTKSANNLAGHIFRSFDHNGDGSISFKELMYSLSVTTRGSVREKLEWAFQVYDVDQNGSITIDEISSIVKCMQNNYKGISTERTSRDITTTEIYEMFESVDSNSDGLLTLDEFVDGIQSHPRFVRMLNGSCTRHSGSGNSGNSGEKTRK